MINFGNIRNPEQFNVRSSNIPTYTIEGIEGVSAIELAGTQALEEATRACSPFNIAYSTIT